MKKITRIFTLLLLGLLLGLTVAACAPKEDEKPEETLYTVTFDLNYEGAPAGPKAQEVKEGEKPNAPMEPTRDGYIFKGWFDKKEDGEEYRFNVGITKDTTFYAQWEIESEDGLAVYYLGGSFSSYSEKHQDFRMIPVEGEEGIYELTVELTNENRDNAFDGHYYKVTDGTWNAGGCWGIDNYYINPAPQSPTGGGMGSVWHWANGTLTVRWDSIEMLITDTLEIHEDIVEDVYSIYGEFNMWDMEGENALFLQDFDGDGFYNGEYTFEEDVESDFAVVVSKLWWDDQWGQRWGAHEQYRFDGTQSGMGAAEKIEFKAGRYLFTYNSLTHETTFIEVKADTVHTFEYPRMYGKFNGWKHDNHEDTAVLLNVPGDIYYRVELEFEEDIESDFGIVLSQKFYDDEWGQRWGVEGQYKFDGTPAGMGNSTELNLVAGRYLFTYNSLTHETVYEKIEKDSVYEFAYPRLYGEFNMWGYNSHINGVVLVNVPGNHIYHVELEFEEAITSDFGIVLSQKFYDDEWGQRWGVEGQYKFDGTPAGMGNSTELELTAGRYLFTFNMETKETTYVKVEADVVYEYESPRVYGKFNGWNIEGFDAIALIENEQGKFVGEIIVDEAIETDMLVVLSKKYYDDEWGQRWGAEEQYPVLENNDPIELEVGTYILEFDPLTKKLTVTKK